MNDYSLPLMRARTAIREAEEAIEEGRFDQAAEAMVTARGHLSDALYATYDEMRDRSHEKAQQVPAAG